MNAAPNATSRRADAVHNRSALLAAGERVFARSGVDVPMEEVAREAGVGRGTLYRHFPSREHLLGALMEEQAACLAAEARRLLDEEPVWEGLVSWLRRYDEALARFRGAGHHVGPGLTGTSPVATACHPMRVAFAALLDHMSVLVRPGITAEQVLALVAALPKDPDTGGAQAQCLDIVVRGLRA
ncbi:TetR family transcriptional regulator [Streptomyces sulfonofaciens]|uniref:TetR family transcriptional regulator n=1 Tax=Streptomyces sulfonofaciens TaxID=68272 RepID=A0A919L845_9ACTN|nr:TetR/AcrR family transcriptional regulator [Streptomyces sulfonofaciens]GHH86186.1 TetR family transcriptional regulator [Streptomyces sulfonofaciens]